MSGKLFDNSVVREPREAVDFITNILESSTEYSIIGMDLEGTILLWNEGARRIYGYEPDEVIGHSNAAILYSREDVESGKPREILDTALQSGKWEGTLNRVRKNGQSFTARVVITPRHDASGGSSGFLLISKDISSEIHLTEELKAAQFYTRSLIESNIDALMTTDPLGVISDVNLQMCKMTGRSREELVGTPFKNYFAQPEHAEDGIRKVLTEDRVTNYELTMRSRDGRETVVSYNATIFRDAEGKLQGVFAAARDITEQKRLEEDLRQVQNYTRGLIESSVDALVTVNPQFRITDVNEQMIRMTGYSRAELIDSPFPDYFTDADMATSGVQQTLDAGFVTNYVLILRAKGGNETSVSFNASIFKDTEGNVRGIFAAARDITAQKNLEEQLRQAQNYNRGLIESSVDPMITVDPDLIITDVNQQMVRLTETVKEELIGSHFNAYFTEPERATAGVQQTLRESFVTNYELTLRTPNGREILVSFNASVFKDTQGTIRGIFAVARDVTEQRRLEGQINEQQNYSRSLIEASVDALVTVNPQGRITDVNEQFVKLMGQSRQQLIESSFSSYFTDPERAMSGVRQTFEEGIVTNYELVVHSKAARKIPVSFNAAVFRDTTGEVMGILAAARDITQQKRIEEELREQQSYTRSLIESNIDALMTTDPLGVISDVNLQMCEMTGRSREELVGTPFKDYFTDPKRAEDGIRKVLIEGRVPNYELTIKASGGRETVVSYNATTFRGTDGRLRGVFAAARDITEQKTLEDQLQRKNEELVVQYRRVQEANRLKSEFLANMSHELRTPLNGIIGFTEMMYDGETGDISSEQHEYLGDILSCSRHLLQLINDVLDLAKVEAGKMVFSPEQVDLKQLVNEVRDILRLLINNKRIRFEIEIDASLSPVVIDSSKLKQVLYNYLSNALKFTSDEGRVTVRIKPDGKDAFLLEVEDSGVGIEHEDLGRLFVEFQQLDAGTAKKHQGTGLGLALTKRIVEAQGGSVGVRSVLGQGSTFFASLPRVNKTQGEFEEQDHSVDWTSTLLPVGEGAPSILMIEDDPRDRDWLLRAFAGAGYKVETAATAAEALRRCQQQVFDIITLDLLLPDASGWDVLRRIRHNSPNSNTPVIVVTMVAEKNVAMGLPIQDILSKPVQINELLATLARVRSVASAAANHH